MPANTILTRYADEVGRGATVTINVGTDPGDDDYGPAQLVTDNPAQVAKILDATGAWSLDMGVATRVKLAALIHHDFDAPGDASPEARVVLQGNATNVWTTPSFEMAFTIPPWRAAGTRRWPVNPWIDLTTDSEYSDTGFRWWRLLVEDNSQDLQLGALKLYSDFIRLESDFREGLGRGSSSPIIDNRTAFLVDTIYVRNTHQWTQDGTLRLPTALADEIEAHYFDTTGRGYPFLVVPNGLRNNCYFVRRTSTDFREAVIFYDEDADNELMDMPFAVEEVGRGLRPGV